MANFLGSIGDAAQNVIEAWSDNVSTNAELAQVRLEQLRIQQVRAAAEIQQRAELMRIANKAVIFLAILAALAIGARFIKKG